MADLLRSFADATPNAPAIIDADSTTTWAKLNERVNRCINAGRSLGIDEGDTVVLMGGNRHETYEITLAACHAGWVLVPVNWHWVADELAYVLTDCGAKAIFVGAAWVDVAKAAASESLAVNVVISPDDHDGFFAYESLLAEASPEEPATQHMGGPMFYTSGTTGFPKGVRGALATTQGDASIWQLIAAGMAQMMRMPAERLVQLVCGPNYHSAQWIFGIVALIQGGTVVLQHRFDAAEALALIDAHHVTGVHLVPAQFRRFVDLDEQTKADFDGSSLTAVFHGAAPCPHELKRQLIAWWGPVIWEYYGGTEGGFLSVISSSDWLDHPGSVGKILDTAEVVALDDDGQPLEQGQTGELAFRSRLGNDFKYHNAPEKTASAHRENGFATLGDVGHIDVDGYLYITDRKIDMVISGGVNIYPAEIEALLANHPSVTDVAVIGIADDHMGEALLAIVEPFDFTEAGEHLTAELTRYCRAHLAGYKCPRHWRYVESIGRNPVGKLDKSALRATYGV